MTDYCLGRQGASVNEEKGFNLQRTKWPCVKSASVMKHGGGMRCCTLYSRRDGLHSVNALTVISEHGGKHLRRTRERSPRATRKC